jgi:hypothetical protein
MIHGDAEINEFRDRQALLSRHQNVGGLEVQVEDAPVVRVLHGLANKDEELKPRLEVQPLLLAILRDADARYEFHDQKGPASSAVAGAQKIDDVRVVQACQSQAFGSEAGKCDIAVRARFEKLQCHATAARELLGSVNLAATAFTKLLEKSESL